MDHHRRLDAAVAAQVALQVLLLLSSPATVVRVLCGRPVWLTDGDTLYLRWQSGLGLLDHCSVVLPNGTETTLPDATTTVSPANITYVGDGYQSGQCGLRAVSVTPGVGNWTLTASSADGRHGRDTSHVTCIAKQWPKSNTIRVPVGTAVNVTCGPPKAFYCRMSGPSGEVSRHKGQCWVHVKSVGSHHLDVWTCWSVTAESAAEVQYTVRLHAYREGAVTEVGCDETPTEVRVFCNVRNGTATPDGGDGNAVGRDGHFRSKYCRITLPRDAKILSLAYGRGTTRYSYHGATYNDCGVSFAKPLRRSEIGRWKCMNAMSDDRVYGGFVVVVPPNNTKAGIPPLTVTTGRSVMVPKGNTFHVECSVHSEIDYCWLRHPNGTAIPVTVPDSTAAGDPKRVGTRYRYTGEGLSFGQCHVAIDDASTLDTGPWLCALGLRDDRREMYGTVDVTVSESVIAARQEELYATEGTQVTLGCDTVEKQPIAYCRFLTPRLLGFAVDEKSDAQPPPRYTYSGQGLTAGHCGLSVDRVDDSDYGNWTCAVKILDSSGSEEVSTTVLLRKPEGFTMIQIIGIVLCGTMISIMSLFFANHLITNPSAKTTKKIEKLEMQLEAGEQGASRRVGARRAQNSTRVIRTQPGRSKHGSIPRRI
ncbi:uncharacterized protein LOC100574655 isoform X1 [Acyrthosiphon pisum]|uniref:Immunoglobulin domain-containing protein n=1 Tax=Acyrthosiphon pisum TaxID=7029 RepID=A0A8R2FBC3_ACYPI|nr:uncharacterized protein LOC100574655 isoform X1 [Acyrthosiphon pisum]|eukprot:XP_008186993.1 PREDICTED: uncharacterized protein LOC100574655 isoform X1 [Acyrthosiphon pisum]